MSVAIPEGAVKLLRPHLNLSPADGGRGRTRKEEERKMTEERTRGERREERRRKRRKMRVIGRSVRTLQRIIMRRAEKGKEDKGR